MDIVSRSGRPVLERLCRTLEPSWGAYARPLRTLDGPRDGPEKDFDPDLFQIAIRKVHHLVESFLANCLLGLLKSFILTLDDCPSYRTLSLFISLHASFKRHVKKNQGGGVWHFLAKSSRSFRAWPVKAVESTTHSRFTVSRCSTRKCTNAKACPLTRWSRSSSAMRARAQSEEMICVGRKCRWAKVDFPQAAGPQSTTIEGLRMRSEVPPVSGVFSGSIRN